MYALTTETATIIAGSEVGFRLLRPEEGAMVRLLAEVTERRDSFDAIIRTLSER